MASWERGAGTWAWCLVMSFLWGCPPSEVEEVSPVPSLQPACLEVEGEQLETRVVTAATTTCAGNRCELVLPAEEVSGTRMRAHGNTLAVERDADSLIIVGEEEVSVVEVPGMETFSVGADEQVWLVVDGEIVAIDTSGRVDRRCSVPADSGRVRDVVQTRQGVLVSTVVEATVEPLLFLGTEGGWAELETEVNAIEMVPFREDQVFVLGVGYYEVQDLATGTRELLGGSDDDFSGVAVCEDGSYWVGGMTGILAWCEATHACTDVDAEPSGYPFQGFGHSRVCGADRTLHWRDPLQDEVGSIQLDGVRTSSPLPVEVRSEWAHLGRSWTVSNP